MWTDWTPERHGQALDLVRYIMNDPRNDLLDDSSELVIALNHLVKMIEEYEAVHYPMLSSF